MNTISRAAVDIANDVLMMEEILQPKIDKIMKDAEELGNPLHVGQAIIHALRHNEITPLQAEALRLNHHII